MKHKKKKHSKHKIHPKNRKHTHSNSNQIAIICPSENQQLDKTSTETNQSLDETSKDTNQNTDTSKETHKALSTETPNIVEAQNAQEHPAENHSCEEQTAEQHSHEKQSEEQGNKNAGRKKRIAILLPILLLFALIIIDQTKEKAEPVAEESIFTPAELAIINDTLQPIMKVYSIYNHPDSLVLRDSTIDFTPAELQSAAYRTLCQRMIKTVTDTTVGGVGIAGPQVGLSRRIVAVQRFDKEDYPFETYPNIYITAYSDSTEIGGEGCLSVPGMRGMVKRSQSVVITYTCPTTLQTVQDTVKGFTARIFQHETDHLEGIIYTDKMEADLGY